MWGLKREEELVLLIILFALIAGIGIKIAGGIPVAPPPQKPAMIRIKVEGAVKKPGWYKVPENFSVEKIIEKAGGSLPWADISNMDLSSPPASDTVYIPEGKLDLNTAEKEDFVFLPGIGPELAKRIVEYREKVGGFEDIEQLKNVPGIGEKRFEKIKNRVTVKKKKG